MAYYRTRTYLAADWDGDRELIDKLHEWNDSEYWSLHFPDAHDLMQARDTSMYCTIKGSLKKRLSASKTFVLIVGEKTDKLAKGGCQYCQSYNRYTMSCAKGKFVDYRSYIQFECENAVNNNLRIVVIYNFSTIQKSKCPEILRDKGRHLTAFHYDLYNRKCYNYQSIKTAIMG